MVCKAFYVSANPKILISPQPHWQAATLLYGSYCHLGKNTC
jgi:hypothetical protein